VIKKRVLLIDDEPMFLEPLSDALKSKDITVIIAKNASAGLYVLEKNIIDLVTIDIMIDPGPGLKGKVEAHRAGIYLCEYISKHYRNVYAYCLSVVSDEDTIKYIQSLGINFLRKGETPLRTILELIFKKLSIK
jgi:DNA-binding NarL/FixJ family response regulator